VNKRSELDDIMQEWLDEGSSGKSILNYITEFLIEDVHWTNQNISKVDRENLIKLAERLKLS